VTSRRIVVDANILIRAVLGVRVRQLIARYGTGISIFAPEIAFTDAARYLPVIASKRSADPVTLLATLDQLHLLVETVPDDILEPLRDVALKRIGYRDPMDWPYVAAAMALNCPIWTEDNDFFGSGIPTWTTGNVEIYLSGE